MSDRIDKIAAVLLAGHPTTGAYSAVDVTALAEINALNRPADVAIETLLRFLSVENTHQTDGTDTQDRSLWQRMKEVVSLAIVPFEAVANPWGSTEVGTITEIQQLKTHQLFDYLTLSAQGPLPIDMTNTEFQVFLSGAQAAGVMSEAQETAFIALADNLQSHAQEEGLGIVRLGEIIEARA